jgi:hypothetical protein
MARRSTTRGPVLQRIDILPPGDAEIETPKTGPYRQQQ